MPDPKFLEPWHGIPGDQINMGDSDTSPSLSGASR